MLHRTLARPMRRARAVAVFGALSLVAVVTATTGTASALTTPVLVTRAAVGTNYANNVANENVISGNGNFYAFSYLGTDIFNGTDTNSAMDVFVYNRLTKTLRLVSHRAGSLTETANAGSVVRGISDDGNKILIESLATNLVTGFSAGGGATHYFLVDMTTNTTTLVDRAAGSTNTAANGSQDAAFLSADGNFVAYSSSATNIINNYVSGGGNRNVYRFNALTGFNILVSHETGSPNRGATSIATPTAITPNGALISYVSTSTNLVDGFVDNNGGDSNVYLWNRPENASVLASHRSGSQVASGNGGAYGFVTRSGTRVLMMSRSTNHRSDFIDNNGSGFDVFDYSVNAKTIFLVSRSASNAAAGANQTVTLQSANSTGSTALLRTTATNLVAGFVDNNGPSGLDLFVAGRAPFATALVSRAAGSTTSGANRDIATGTISSDGRVVAFISSSNNLITGYDATVTKTEAFAASVSTGAIRLMSGVRGSEVRGANGDAEIATSTSAISADGAIVSFSSRASNQISGFPAAIPANRQLYLNSTGL